MPEEPYEEENLVEKAEADFFEVIEQGKKKKERDDERKKAEALVIEEREKQDMRKVTPPLSGQRCLAGGTCRRTATPRRGHVS